MTQAVGLQWMLLELLYIIDSIQNKKEEERDEEVIKKKNSKEKLEYK